jgi:acyl-CoA thioester hydrolase
MGKMNYVSNLKEWQSDFSFKITVKVRFNETDMFGHMNNTVPFTYFEEARIEYLKSLGFMQEWTSLDSHIIPVVADLQCDFLQQVYFDEYINVYVKVSNVGNSSIDLHYMGINKNQEICFTGRNSLVNLNRFTGKSEAWRDDWKEKLIKQINVTSNV